MMDVMVVYEVGMGPLKEFTENETVFIDPGVPNAGRPPVNAFR